MMYGNFTERELDAFWIGTETEKTRIIKLLEETITNWRIADLHQQADLFDYAIATIKGEKYEHPNF